MSTSSSSSAKYAWRFVAALGVLIAIPVVVRWEGWDSRIRDRPTPRLLAEGAPGDGRWVALQVGDCVHLRQNGLEVARSCAEFIMKPIGGRPDLDRLAMPGYRVHLVRLHGVERPMLFGVLPPGSAFAEVASDGSATDPRFRTAAMVQVPVRTFGDAGRFVAEPAPADPKWQDSTDLVPIELHDSHHRRLTPG